MRFAAKIMIAGLMSCAFLTGTQAQVQAEDKIAKEQAGDSRLVQLVEDMNKAMRAHDAAFIANNMPKRLYQEMAARLQKSESELRADFQKSVSALFEHLTGGGYTLDSANARYARTKSGTFYALVPTRVETKDNIAEFITLALYDDDGWHLIYGGQKTVQNPVFQEIYPDFVSVQIPLETVTQK